MGYVGVVGTFGLSQDYVKDGNQTKGYALELRLQSASPESWPTISVDFASPGS